MKKHVTIKIPSIPKPKLPKFPKRRKSYYGPVGFKENFDYFMERYVNDTLNDIRQMIRDRDILNICVAFIFIIVGGVIGIGIGKAVLSLM